jgi:hypothetical protein
VCERIDHTYKDDYELIHTYTATRFSPATKFLAATDKHEQHSYLVRELLLTHAKEHSPMHGLLGKLLTKGVKSSFCQPLLHALIGPLPTIIVNVARLQIGDGGGE